MKKYCLIFFCLPFWVFGQHDFPSYANGEGYPLSYLDPALSDSPQAVIWVSSEDFLSKYGFEDVFYVSREPENHGGGMHQSWNITYLDWGEEGFSEMWHVHHDTTFWEVDPFVEALPDLEDTRVVNGTDYYLSENSFLVDWGFTGYGVGSRYYFRCQKQSEGYYLQLFSTDKFGGEENEEFVAYSFLKPNGLPQHRMYMEGNQLEFLKSYVYDAEQNFLQIKGEMPFIEKIQHAPFHPTPKRYQLYANDQHFSEQVQKAFTYLPEHILVGFWRFGYIHFRYHADADKYYVEGIVPFF